MVVMILASVLLPVVTSCDGTDTGNSISLEFAPGHNTESSYDITGFDTEGNFVLRCASFENNENGIEIMTSKSKNMKANTLIFAKSSETGSSEANVQIATVPITGKEYEYDMTMARYYTITFSSAIVAIEAYGIPYLDWQIGVCSTSEQFPCCE